MRIKTQNILKTRYIVWRTGNVIRNQMDVPVKQYLPFESKFTYIDVIVEVIERLLPNPPVADEKAAHQVYNIGNNRPEKLMVFIETLEKCLSRSLGKEVHFEKTFEPIKPGDVPATYASTDLLEQAVGFKPKTSIEEGLQKFTDWYVEYYKVK